MTVTETLPSRLMPDILHRLAEMSPLMVLDVGFGVHETVEHFGNRRCKLHFLGLPDALRSPPVLPSPAQKTGKIVDEAARQENLLNAWRERFRSVLDFPEDTRFDLCLFWDAFNYMDDLALKAFFEVLHPYIRKETLGHGLIQLKEDKQVTNREYGIQAPDLLAMRPGHHSALACHPRPQARVAAMLKGFAVSHGVLRRDGLLEVSLKTE
ncbi:hypothetical protein [Pseudohongiella sp.]|uniref:Methyltransferase type 11 domain-containing protein n=1 Tax=marine sediment metagenome TaxID=412755 RepID=A0A0F9YKD7_9ZZZZ|nr:hypothetical protein [Pseudohongiella sp.]HDZ08202.1 hypothetical protein [Pseudohongiella sp.]HEA63170.1 hypothetical protein [Pseudohongiella sp.]